MFTKYRMFHVMIAGSAIFLAACGSSGSETTLESADSGGDSSAAEITTTTVAEIFSRNDFAQVCRGTGLATTAAYAPDAELSPIVVLEGEDPDYSGSLVILPDGWETDFGSFETTQLVGCLDRVSATPAELCEGYADDESGISWSVQTHDSSYEMTLRDSQTAEIVAEATFEGPADGCPMFSSYTEGDPDPVLDYDVPSTEIEVFLKEYVTGA